MEAIAWSQEWQRAGIAILVVLWFICPLLAARALQHAVVDDSGRE